MEVVKLLLGPEGSAKATATAADKVRRALPTPPLALPSLHLGPTHVLPVLCSPPSLPLLLGALAEAFPRAPRHMQDGKLSLHYAAAKGASLEVTSLLLEANRNAPGVLDNVRRCTHTPSRTLLSDLCTEAVHCEPPCRTKGYRYTTPPRTAHRSM